MIYPKIETNKEKSFIVDSFSHGIDLLDGSAVIKNSSNLIYNNGLLITRGGLRIPKKAPFYNATKDVIDEPNFCETPILYKGKKCRLLYFMFNDEMSNVIYRFYLLDEETGATKIASLTFSRASSTEFNVPNSILVFSSAPKKGCGIYVFAGMFNNTDEDDYSDAIRVFELNSTMTSWLRVNESEMHIPDYYINGRGVLYFESGIDVPNPIFNEPMNMLSSYFRCRFTADSVSTAFKLPIDKIQHKYFKFFRCELLLSDGETLTWTVYPDSAISNEVEYGGQKTTVTFNTSTGVFYFNNIIPLGYSDVSNNIVVTLSITNPENLKKIANMNMGVWYSSEKAGTHLCVTGNRLFPSLLCISGENNPLYFPDNSCYYVGEPSGKITVMARQNKALVLFKEKEIYCAEYISGKLSITHLHSNIGCDLPSTVALCENRLVWANSDRRVYTLNALSDYGVVAVYGMSKAIDAWLNADDFTDAAACYLNKRYYLFLKKQVYVLDLSGALLQSNREFVSAASWFKWELPENTQIKFIYSGISAANVVFTFDETEYYLGNLSGDNGNDEIIYLKNGIVTFKNALIKGQLTTGVMAGDNFFSNKIFTKVFFNIFAKNNVSVSFLGDTGDTVKNSLINIKYNNKEAVTPHRVLSLIRSHGFSVKLNFSGSFKLNRITCFYRETV